ncbi:hypothetical protein PV05_08677 [Exophiala xenobiotica]|uniref:Aldehyde dehydrogenase domain-containing protein n=1 Tax=Exophiala xenobiotica TaxID=348802 RepID=A0A0D2EZC8_9EURO|nr:uncharacterized protein PV05_08677 [Exophiala xenobiotica]KIW53079.1 hypothetical protein PV05_08677 [Exophiala xenobiotica]
MTAATNGINGHTVPGIQEGQLLYIDGQYRPAAGSSTFDVINPMTGKKIYQSASAGVDDYEAAILGAHNAYQTWSRTSPTARRLIMLKAADIIEGYMRTDGPEILSSEVSATKAWVKVNLMATAGILRETAGLVTHMKGEIVPADRPGTTILVTREPVGVVFAISPWNAPVNLTARAIASPLICGNTVVLKPSEFSPKSQHLVVRAFIEAGLPAGCLNFLPTSPQDAAAVTEYTVKHRKVLRVNFTGSDRVGKIIAGWAATCMKQCVLECGGKAPVLVLEDANIEDAVESVVFGALSNSGQICMSTERVIVHDSIAQDFQARLLERVRKVSYGNHLESPDVSMSGLYSCKSAERVLGMVKTAVDDGAKLLLGDMQTTGPNKTIVGPHVLGNVTPSMKIFQEESFGPLICLSTTSSDDEAVELANDSEFSLCASVFSKDVLRAMEVARRVRAGSCHINGPTVYIEATLPNGGTGGASGYGRFGGIAGVEEFTERKIVSLVKPGMKYAF